MGYFKLLANFTPFKNVFYAKCIAKLVRNKTLIKVINCTPIIIDKF